jgi:hypothetical protein
MTCKRVLLRHGLNAIIRVLMLMEESRSFKNDPAGRGQRFLESMGWPKWKAQKEWFLREIMSLSDNDIRTERNWSLLHSHGAKLVPLLKRLC